MFVRVNDDIIIVDKLIKAEYIAKPHNKSILRLTYIVDDIDAKDPVTISEFINVAKNSISVLAKALEEHKDFVDLSKNS